jgi:hypothetical protein
MMMSSESRNLVDRVFERLNALSPEELRRRVDEFQGEEIADFFSDLRHIEEPSFGLQYAYAMQPGPFVSQFSNANTVILEPSASPNYIVGDPLSWGTVVFWNRSPAVNPFHYVPPEFLNTVLGRIQGTISQWPGQELTTRTAPKSLVQQNAFPEEKPAENDDRNRREAFPLAA